MEFIKIRWNSLELMNSGMPEKMHHGTSFTMNFEFYLSKTSEDLMSLSVFSLSVSETSRCWYWPLTCLASFSDNLGQSVKNFWFKKM